MTDKDSEWPIVLKYGGGYFLVAVSEGTRIVLAIRCASCLRLSFNPNDIAQRYCPACHAFHDDENGAMA